MDIDRRRADRLKVLEEVYDRTDANDRTLVDGDAICATLGLSRDYLGNVVRYLEAKGLVGGHWVMSGHVSINITAQGIDVVETMRSEPDRETTEFASHNQTVNIYGSVSNSQIAQAGGDASQSLMITVEDRQQIQSFVDSFQAALPEIQLDTDVEAEVIAELDTVNAQLRSPRPKRQTLQTSLNFLRDVAANLTASGVASGLIAAAQSPGLLNIATDTRADKQPAPGVQSSIRSRCARNHGGNRIVTDSLKNDLVVAIVSMKMERPS